MAWLLDTNILSEIRRLRPEPKVLAFIAGNRLDELYISSVTLADLRFGLLEEGRKTGHTFSQPDLIIAATGLHHGLTVVTRDRSDFDKARVQVLNPWET
jgi:toxin FitB